MGGDGRAPCLLLGQRGLHNEALAATAAAPGAGVLLEKRVWVRAGGPLRARPPAAGQVFLRTQRNGRASEGCSRDALFRAAAGVTATEPPDHRPRAHASLPGPRWQLPARLTDHWASVPLEDAAEQLVLPRPNRPACPYRQTLGGPGSGQSRQLWGQTCLGNLCTWVGAVGPSAQTPDQQRGLGPGGLRGLGPGGLRRETAGNQKGLTRGRKREVLAPTSPGHMEERLAGPPAGVSSSGQAGHGQAVTRCPLTWRQAWPGHPGQRQESRTQAQVRPPQSEGSGRHPPACLASPPSSQETGTAKP